MLHRYERVCDAFLQHALATSTSSTEPCPVLQREPAPIRPRIKEDPGRFREVSTHDLYPERLTSAHTIP